jgi:hypothetical protein
LGSGAAKAWGAATKPAKFAATAAAAASFRAGLADCRTDIVIPFARRWTLIVVLNVRRAESQKYRAIPYVSARCELAVLALPRSRW